MVGQRPVPAASDAGVGAPRVGLFLGRSVLLVVSNWGSDLGAELNDLGMLKWSIGLEIGTVAVRIVGFDSAQGRRVSAVGVRP
jgi:hypothetical protein